MKYEEFLHRNDMLFDDIPDTKNGGFYIIKMQIFQLILISLSIQICIERSYAQPAILGLLPLPSQMSSFLRFPQVSLQFYSLSTVSPFPIVREHRKRISSLLRLTARILFPRKKKRRISRCCCAHFHEINGMVVYSYIHIRVGCLEKNVVDDLNRHQSRIKVGILFAFHRCLCQWKNIQRKRDLYQSGQRNKGGAGSLADVISNLLTGREYEWIQ